MVEYRLKTPVSVGEETVDVLKLKEPDLGSLVDAGVALDEESLQTAKGMMKLILACSTNITEAHARKIKFSDLGSAVEVCADFFT